MCFPHHGAHTLADVSGGIPGGLLVHKKDVLTGGRDKHANEGWPGGSGICMQMRRWGWGRLFANVDLLVLLMQEGSVERIWDRGREQMSRDCMSSIVCWVVVSVM